MIFMLKGDQHVIVANSFLQHQRQSHSEALTVHHPYPYWFCSQSCYTVFWCFLFKWNMLKHLFDTVRFFEIEAAMLGADGFNYTVCSLSWLPAFPARNVCFSRLSLEDVKTTSTSRWMRGNPLFGRHSRPPKMWQNWFHKSGLFVQVIFLFMFALDEALGMKWGPTCPHLLPLLFTLSSRWWALQVS